MLRKTYRFQFLHQTTKNRFPSSSRILLAAQQKPSTAVQQSDDSNNQQQKDDNSSSLLGSLSSAASSSSIPQTITIPKSANEIRHLWETMPCLMMTQQQQTSSSSDSTKSSNKKKDISSRHNKHHYSVAHESVNLLWHLITKNKAPLPNILPQTSTITSATFNNNNNNSSSNNNSNNGSSENSSSSSLTQTVSRKLKEQKSKHAQREATSSSKNEDNNNNNSDAIDDESHNDINSNRKYSSGPNNTISSKLAYQLSTPNARRYTSTTLLLQQQQHSPDDGASYSSSSALDCYDFLLPLSRTHNRPLDHCQLLVSSSISLLEHAIIILSTIENKNNNNNNKHKNASTMIHQAIQQLDDAIATASTLGANVKTLHWRCLLSVAHLAQYHHHHHHHHHGNNNIDNHTRHHHHLSLASSSLDEAILLADEIHREKIDEQFGRDRPGAVEKTVKVLPSLLKHCFDMEFSSADGKDFSSTSSSSFLSNSSSSTSSRTKKNPELEFERLEQQISKQASYFTNVSKHFASSSSSSQQQHQQLAPSMIEFLQRHQTILAALLLQALCLCRAYSRSTVFSSNFVPFLVIHTNSSNNNNSDTNNNNKTTVINLSNSQNPYRRLLSVIEQLTGGSNNQDNHPLSLIGEWSPLDGFLVIARHEALRYLLPITRLDNKNDTGTTAAIDELKRHVVDATTSLLSYLSSSSEKEKQTVTNTSTTKSKRNDKINIIMKNRISAIIGPELVRLILTCAFLTLESETTAKSASTFGAAILNNNNNSQQSGESFNNINNNNNRSSRALAQYALAFALAKRFQIPGSTLDRSKLEYCNALCRAGRVEVAASIIVEVTKRVYKNLKMNNNNSNQINRSLQHQITRFGESSLPLRLCELHLVCGAFFQSLGNTYSNNQAAELMYQLAIESAKKQMVIEEKKAAAAAALLLSTNNKNNRTNHLFLLQQQQQHQQQYYQATPITIRTYGKACESYGYLVLLRGRSDDAHQQFRKVLSLMLKAPHVFPPSSATQTRFRYALALESANQANRARRVYDQLLNASATLNLSLGEKLSMTLRSALLHHYTLGEYTEAAALYFVSLALDSENPHNIVQLGWCMLQISESPDVEYIKKYYDGALLVLYCCQLASDNNGASLLEPIIFRNSSSNNNISPENSKNDNIRKKKSTSGSNNDENGDESASNNTTALATTISRISSAMQCTGPWDACYVLGECAVFYHDHLGDLETAKYLYEQALSAASPEATDNYAQVAANFAVLLCYDLKDTPNAEKWFEEAIKYPNAHNEAALVHLFSEFLLQTGKINRAAEELGRIAGKYGLSDTWHRLAKVEERLHRNNSYNYAVSCYCKALGASNLDVAHHHQNTQEEQKEKKQQEKNIETQQQGDNDQQQLKDAEKTITSATTAANEIEQQRQQSPRLLMPSDEGLKQLFINNVSDDMTLPIASDLLLLLHHKYSSTKLSLIDSLYRILCRTFSQDVFLLVNYARFLNDVAFKPKSALTKFRQALLVDRTSVALLDNLAEHLTQVYPERLDLAERCHLESVRENPFDPQAHFAYACFLSYYYPSNELAEQHFHRALELDRSDTVSLCSYAAFLEAMIENNGPAWEARTDATHYAEEMYREAIRLSPHTASHHLQLACFLWRESRLQDAWKSFEKCLELDRANVNALRLAATFLQDCLVTYGGQLDNKNPSNSDAGAHSSARDPQNDPRNIKSSSKLGNNNPPTKGNNNSNSRSKHSSSSSFLGNSNNSAASSEHQKRIEYLINIAFNLFKRAVQLDPRDVAVLRSFASFCAEVKRDEIAARELMEEANRLELETLMAKKRVQEKGNSLDDVDEEEDNNDNDSEDEKKDDNGDNK